MPLHAVTPACAQNRAILHTMPHLVLLPGLACDARIWEAQLPALPAAYRVHVSDTQLHNDSIEGMAAAVLRDNDGPAGSVRRVDGRHGRHGSGPPGAGAHRRPGPAGHQRAARDARDVHAARGRHRILRAWRGARRDRAQRLFRLPPRAGGRSGDGAALPRHRARCGRRTAHPAEPRGDAPARCAPAPERVARARCCWCAATPTAWRAPECTRRSRRSAAAPRWCGCPNAATC